MDSEGLFPVTSAMGHEFMRQGHYDRAVEIFDVLIQKHPEDSALKQARETARKRGMETKMVGVLSGWLGRVDKMKSKYPPKQ